MKNLKMLGFLVVLLSFLAGCKEEEEVTTDWENKEIELEEMEATERSCSKDICFRTEVEGIVCANNSLEGNWICGKYLGRLLLFNHKETEFIIRGNGFTGATFYATKAGDDFSYTIQVLDDTSLKLIVEKDSGREREKIRVYGRKNGVNVVRAFDVLGTYLDRNSGTVFHYGGSWFGAFSTREKVLGEWRNWSQYPISGFYIPEVGDIIYFGERAATVIDIRHYAKYDAVKTFEANYDCRNVTSTRTWRRDKETGKFTNSRGEFVFDRYLR
jgi:hypothetical protein